MNRTSEFQNKIIRFLLIIGYIYFILTKTILGRTVQSEAIFRGIFWELQNGMWTNIRLNILLFIPLGFLIGGWKGVVIGFALSCGIEMLQYVCRTGFCEIDDILITQLVLVLEQEFKQ